jgi:hypothetical protein
MDVIEEEKMRPLAGAPRNAASVNDGMAMSAPRTPREGPTRRRLSQEWGEQP